MKPADLELLKTRRDKRVRIKTADGEQILAKVIYVFDGESDADMFFELVSTSHSSLYPKRKNVGGYSLPLEKIASVELPVEEE